MSTNKKERNTQIPVEAIKGSAGKDDEFTVVMSEPYICSERDGKQFTTTEIGEYAKREVAPNSMELTEGMIIKAEIGERETISKDEEPEI